MVHKRFEEAVRKSDINRGSRACGKLIVWGNGLVHRHNGDSDEPEEQHLQQVRGREVVKGALEFAIVRDAGRSEV